ncbi:hypothetical protein EXIGLDRAFT_215296 [Exidia glandulosa HHB12029]|uniref:Uncharacterized protein n=1 Tax=Exidia glandulosa HHB12029 TaxID=1314781 RepID=A0A165MU83_EXIGL|nr:hypothetical protein EXIGLDRAFT_215296 [Exidia glandulosa HHB12029]
MMDAPPNLSRSGDFVGCSCCLDSTTTLEPRIDFFTTPATAYLPYAATPIPIPTHASQGFAPLIYTPRHPAYSEFGRQTEARADKLSQPPLARPYPPPHVQWAPDVPPEPPLYDQHRRPHPQYEPSDTHGAQFAPDQSLPSHDRVPP